MTPDCAITPDRAMNGNLYGTYLNATQASQENSSVPPVTAQFVNACNAVVSVVPYRCRSL